MDKIHAFIDKLQAVFGPEASYLHILYKTAIAIAVLLIVWFVLKTILNYIWKRVKKYKFISIDDLVKSRKTSFFVIPAKAGHVVKL
jgi:hypothetical protein